MSTFMRVCIWIIIINVIYQAVFSHGPWSGVFMVILVVGTVVGVVYNFLRAIGRVAGGADQSQQLQDAYNEGMLAEIERHKYERAMRGE